MTFSDFDGLRRALQRPRVTYPHWRRFPLVVLPCACEVKRRRWYAAWLQLQAAEWRRECQEAGYKGLHDV